MTKQNQGSAQIKIRSTDLQEPDCARLNLKFTMTDASITDLQSQIASVTKKLSATPIVSMPSSVAKTPIATSLSIIVEGPITAAGGSISPPAAGSTEVWVPVILQPGGQTISWGAGVYMASTYIDPTANTYSAFIFVYFSGFGGYILAAQPITGQNKT